MANRSDPTTELLYDRFRNGDGRYGEKALTPIVPVPINPPGDTMLPAPDAVPIEKVISPKGGALDFVGLLRSGDQKKVYYKMSRIFRNDMSFKGLNILKKSSKRKQIMQACLDLDASTRSSLGVGTHIRDYNLLALLAALACEGLTNLFESAIDAFPDEIRDIDIANASSDIFRVIDGDHSIPALFDLASSTVAPLVKSTGLLDGSSITNIYDKGTSGTKSDLLGNLSETLTNLTGTSTNSNDISYVGNGRYKKDVTSHVASRHNSGNLSRVVNDTLDSFDLTAMF